MATLEKVAADNCDKMEAGIRYLFMFRWLFRKLFCFKNLRNFQSRCNMPQEFE